MGRLRLWLWRVLPLPSRVRWWIVRAANTRYIVSASAIIFDAEGRLLLLRYTYRSRYAWGLPGGWLHDGESAETGLARQVAEETGLQAVVGPVLRVSSGRQPHVVELLFACQIAGGEFQPSIEVAEAAYSAYDALPAGIAPEAVAIVTWAFAHRSQIKAAVERAAERT